MPNAYSLTVINDSELPSPTFAVFATLPATSEYDTLNLAWLTRQINEGNQYVFTWDITWGFAWAAQGTGAGYQWSGSGTMAADPNSSTECKAIFDYNGDFELTPTNGTPNGSTLWVTDTANIPVPSKQPSSIAVTLGGNSACVTNAGPNLFQTFTLHPTYYINAGDYVQGQMVDGTSVAAFQQLQYAGGNTALTATLGQSNTWTVAPTATVNFAEYFAAREVEEGNGCPPLPQSGYKSQDAGTCYAKGNAKGDILGNNMTAKDCRAIGGKSWVRNSDDSCFTLS